MNAVAARRSGAPSPPVRIVSLVLAALGSGIALFALLLGLSVQAIEAMRTAPALVELTPFAEPTPPPPEPPRAAVEKPRLEPAAAAASAPPAAAPPATPVDQPPAPLAPPAPPSAPESAGGTGTGAGSGTAEASGGSGAGGSGIGGSGTGGGARLPASWIFKPGTPELLPYNPRRAGIEGVNGQVLLTCRILRTTRAADCRVVAERPRGFGFGKAALKASAIFRLNPPTINGEPDEARRIEIPVAFNNRR